MSNAKRRPLWFGALVAAALSTGAAVHWVQGQTTPPPQTTPLTIKSDPISFRDVVKTVLPAVVTVESKSSSRTRMRRSANEDQSPEQLKKFFDELEKQPAEPHQEVGFGSGFIVDTRGIVVTNYHVVEGAEQVEVTLNDGRKFTSRDVKGDARTDVAIVRFDTKGAKLPWLELGDSGQMEIGDRVLAIGAPFALSGTVTHGIISAKGRDLGVPRFEDYLQTDAAINPGNSGGPLVNLEGKVVGINSAIKSRSGGFQGISLAISSNNVKGVIQQLIREGVVRRGYLGVELVSVLSAEAAKQFGIAETGGVVVANVRAKSPAAKAGLQADDAIIGINGRPVREILELQRTVATLPLNTPVNLDVVRNGQKQSLQVTLEEEPKDYLTAGANSRPRPRRNANTEVETVTVEKAGLELADVTPGIAEQLGLLQTTGALITTVENGTPAAAAKLGARMVITKVNKVPVKNAAAAKTAIEKALSDGGEATLHIVADAGNAIVTLKAK